MADKHSSPEISFFQSTKVRTFIVEKKNIAVFLLLAIVGGIAYFKSFFGGFQFDDYYAIADNPVIKQLDLRFLWGYNKVRFLTNVSFALNYAWGGLHVFGWHLVNNLIHLANSFLIYRLTRLMLQTPHVKEKCDDKGREAVSLFTALIFLAHPLQTEAVTYIVQRATALSALFYLGTIYFYTRARMENKMRYYVVALVSALLGMVSKPTMITLPLSLILYDFFFLSSVADVQKRRTCFIALTALPVAAIPFLFLGTNTLIDISLEAQTQIPPVHYLLTQFNVIIAYIGLLFWPMSQNIDYDFPVAQRLLEYPTLFSFLALLLLMVMALRIFKSHRIISFGILWFLIALGPQSSIFSLMDVIFEHRIYLPSFGLILAVCYGFYQIIKNPKTYIYALSVVVLTCAAATYQRNDLWSRPIDFMEDTVRKSPGKARTHNNLGFLYYKQNQLGKAEGEFVKALSLDSDYFIAKRNLATVYYEKGRTGEAKEMFLELIRERPLFADSYVGLGLVFEKLNERDKAFFLFREALRFNPHHAFAYIGLGNILQDKGDIKGAKKYFEQSVKFNPDSAVAFYNLGNADFKLGNFYEALMHYEKALRLNPSLAMAHNNMGNIFFYFGDYPQALKQYVLAIEKDGSLANAHFNLANTLYALGNIRDSRQAAQTALDLYRQQGRRDMIDKIEEKLKEPGAHAP